MNTLDNPLGLAEAVPATEVLPHQHTIDLLDELQPAPLPTATPSATPTGEVPEPAPGDPLSPEERAYLRSLMRQQIQADVEREVCSDFLERHKVDYKPCPENWQMIAQILDQSGSELNEENLERAFEVCIAHDLLQMPAAESLSASNRQDNIIIGIKNRVSAAEQEAAQPPRQTIRTGIAASGTELPAASETSPDSIAQKIAGLPLDQARSVMAAAMRDARGGKGSSYTSHGL